MGEEEIGEMGRENGGRQARMRDADSALTELRIKAPAVQRGGRAARQS